ncbi:zinc ABC transporter substrate-binding protein [Streptomyces sp. AV19]|nr:metal ABC transporter substrate-binding protein [Streptomyces sp. AV19]MBH1938085.1 zinc ABC transporter substrate-binding protein [Streptomyces sp. AV19]MDG4533577.1 metal ABC transporter substrate-binding protein [Streptomyces sp. AV19]
MNTSHLRPPLRSPRITAPAIALASALGLATLSACAAGDDTDRSPKAADGKLDVVASFYPMEYLAKEIGGDHVTVTGLTKPGQEPHDLELRPRQVASLKKAGAILYLKGLQPAVDDAIKQSGNKNVADAASFTSLKPHGTEVDGHHHEDEHSHHGHHHAHGHVHGGDDPHIWLDPAKYAEVAKGVNNTLAKADPAHREIFRKNTDLLVKKLEDLDKKFADGLRNRASDTFITTHAAFGYLAERYGLTEEAISGIDPVSEPSAARIVELHKLAKEHHVGTVFFETIASPATAKTLAGDLGLRTDVLDPLEGITDKSKGNDYIEVMNSNLTALQRALGTSTP